MHKISVLALTIGVLAIGTAPAAAMPINWDAGTGTWTTGSNWDPTMVPLAGDDASINNGGTANQTGLPITVQDLNIGHRTSGVILPGDVGTGTVNLTNGNATISRNLRVGVTAAGIGLGSTNGTFITSGGVVTPGNVEVDSSVTIGAFQSGLAGTAIGTVDIQSGSLSDIISGTTSLFLGTSSGVGTGDGTLSVAKDISQFSTLRVGEDASTFASSKAIGNLTVGGQISNSGNSILMRIGHASGLGDADGKAEIGTGVKDVLQVDVGTARAASTVTGSALGDLKILSGGLTGDDFGELNVGKTQGSASANGTLAISGGVSGFDDIEIGTVGAGASGNTNGNVDILSGGLTGAVPAHLRVGISEGPGNADGTLTVMGGIIEFDSVEVGRASDAGNGTGNIDIQTGDLTGFGFDSLSVGRKTGAGGGTGDGTLSVTGNVNGFTDLAVGESAGSGDGIGKLSIGGTYTGIGEGAVSVGLTTGGTGNANGTMQVGNGITGVDDVNVGVVQAGASGSATGSLTIIDGNLDTTNLLVGASLGTGVATGRLDLNDNLGIVDDFMVLGLGSTVALGIDGLTRGIDYGAIDAGFSILNGILELNFSFQPLAGVFDLIVSDTMNGILGDFHAVHFFGLDPMTLATFGTVVDQGVAIYRLEIGSGNPIPEPPATVGEPGTLAILFSGLAFFGVARRRRQRQ